MLPLYLLARPANHACFYCQKDFHTVITRGLSPVNPQFVGATSRSRYAFSHGDRASGLYNTKNADLSVKGIVLHLDEISHVPPTTVSNIQPKRKTVA